MDRSPGFGSTDTNSSPYSDSVSLRLRTLLVLNLANISNSPDRSTKSTTPPFNGLCLLVSTRFQVLFHSPPGVLFTFPSRYCSSIGHQVVFWLGGWSPRLPTGFLVSRGTLDTASLTSISTTRLSRSLTGLPRPFVYRCFQILPSTTPTILLPSVWPLPISLATTFGISVDYFSSSYLDVSVQTVPHVYLFYSAYVDGGFSAGFPHSDIRGSRLICSSPRLFAAYRVLLRLLMPRHSPCALFSLTYVEANSISFAFAQAQKLIHFVASPLQIKPACAGL